MEVRLGTPKIALYCRFLQDSFRWRTSSGAQASDLQQALALGVIIIAASIEADRSILVAVSRQIGAAQILDCIFKIGLGVQQTACRAAITHRLGRVMPDLHQAPIDLVASGGVEITLALDNAAGQRLDRKSVV